MKLFSFFPLQKYRVDGISMHPSLKKGDNVLVSKIGRINKGDIVVYSAKERDYIKRVKSISDGKYFLEGDNGEFSTDSRKFGLVDKKEIVGKAIFKY